MRRKSFDTDLGARRALRRLMKMQPLPADLTALSDQVLVDTLRRTCLEANRLLGRLILLLIEVENRRLHEHEAYPSLFEYCRKELRMSEGEAFRRINATRLVRKFPQLLPRIERGDVHLTALVTLRDYFTTENVDELVDAARGKNKFALSELVALLAPRPGVPARLRKIPQHDKGSRVTNAPRGELDALAEALYRLQVTGNRAFRDKIFRARDLMMHSNPKGDLSVIVDRALDALIAQLERQQFGKPLMKIADASLEVVPGSDEAARKTSSTSPVASTSGRKRVEVGASKRPGLARAPKARIAHDNDNHETGRSTSRVARASADESVGTRALDESELHLRQRKSRGASASGGTRGH